MGIGFSSYEIARSGLYVNERGLTVTGHNIANVNTPGYVRQQAIITTGPYQSEPSKYGLMQLGLGADIEQIRQIRHAFLDNIYRQENTSLGYWETRDKTFQDVQAILGEPMNDGLQDTMNQFWDSWQELSKDPDSLTARALVRQRGTTFVNMVNHMGSQLDKLQQDLNSELKVRIGEINQITSQISELNMQILKAETTGDNANDYRDQRNLLVDRLTKLANVEVNEMQDGQLDITLGGYFIVTKSGSTELYAGESSAGASFSVPTIKGTKIEVPVQSGILKGLMTSRGSAAGAGAGKVNEAPNTKADIVFAIDVSNTSASYLGNIKANIVNYANELNKRGIDYNLHLITYGDSASADVNFGTDAAALANAIPAVPLADTGNNFGSAAGTGVIDALEAISTFRTGSGKYTLLFTGESIDGDGGTPVTDISGYTGRLGQIGIKMSVVTGSTYFNAGDPVLESGWDGITAGTGGKLYDINTAPADFAALMKSIVSDVNDSINSGISNKQKGEDILPDLKGRLNAILNIMTREINYLQRSGTDLKGRSGNDFFTAVNSSYPIEMGNIRINPNLDDLNGLVASMNGARGDNTIALQIANLRNKPLMTNTDGVVSIDDYYQLIILGVGNGGAEARTISESQLKLVQSADSYRQSIIGVSMDEEMANMLKYKYAYDANSRIINVVDSMLETVITRMGLAGR